MLNNYVDIDVDEVMDDLPKLNARISVGGPVKNGNLYYLHTREDIAESIPVMPGVFMGGNFDQIRDMLQAGQLKAQDIRFFIGYSGWSPYSSKRKFESVVVCGRRRPVRHHAHRRGQRGLLEAPDLGRRRL